MSVVQTKGDPVGGRQVVVEELALEILEEEIFPPLVELPQKGPTTGALVILEQMFY